MKALLIGNHKEFSEDSTRGNSLKMLLSLIQDWPNMVMFIIQTLALPNLAKSICIFTVV